MILCSFCCKLSFEGDGLSVHKSSFDFMTYLSQALSNRKARLLPFASVCHGSVPVFKTENILVEAEWECFLPRLCGYVGG